MRIEIDGDGVLSAVRPGAAAEGHRAGILLPAPANLHSHAFQRAMAGLSEGRGPDARDSFWTWRHQMYRFVAVLDPDDVEAIAAFAQMQMLEAGFAAVGEFHYLHHQPDGSPYANIAEMAERIAAAAAETGIGLTLLPALYQRGGCDGRPLAPEQKRFANTLDLYARLLERSAVALSALPGDSRLGVAPHSLRAVDAEAIAGALALCPPDGPVHIHVAEQAAEVEEVFRAHGCRPVEYLFSIQPVGDRWCLVHCTHMDSAETAMLAQSGAVAGLCPVTEANLGDGIFSGSDFLAIGGRFGVGSDSNVHISLAAELRMLEYSQRLRDQGRAVMATPERSTGRCLFENAASGGARAIGRRGGGIAEGALADLIALDDDAVDLSGRSGDTLLDTFVFAGGDAPIRDVWAAGRHVVADGRHIKHDAIVARYRRAIAAVEARR